MDTKKYMMIDGLPVEIEDEKNILEVIRKAGIKLPTFCYYSELSIYGACRMCMVENKWGGLDAACSTAPSIYAQQGKCRNHAAFSTLKTIKHPL